MSGNFYIEFDGKRTEYRLRAMTKERPMSEFEKWWRTGWATVAGDKPSDDARAGWNAAIAAAEKVCGEKFDMILSDSHNPSYNEGFEDGCTEAVAALAALREVEG